MRLVSLDVLRGITVAGMILVNNGYGSTFTPLRHAEWNGLSLSDLVFPFFLFIMGVSLYLSMSARGLYFSKKKFLKIAKRSLLLLLIGLLINWFDLAIGHGESVFDNLRFWAVLQRIAICYFIAGLFAITISPAFTIPLAVLLLITYSVIIVCGGGYDPISESNILYQVDAFIFGKAHLYQYSPVDPEGLISTLGALANVFFGFYCGMKIKQAPSVTEKVMSLFVIGTVLTFLGLLTSYALPFNKNIWSPSFALVTSGLCTLMFALVMRGVDTDRRYRGDSAWSGFFQAFGMNPLLIYIVSEFMSILFARLGISEAIYSGCSLILPWPKVASLCYASVFVVINYLIAFPLFRNRIIIKL